MDAFCLSLSYGILNVKLNKMIITSIIVGVFHFFMPLLGNKFGILLFNYVYIKPKYILFFVFLYLSINMILSFFAKNKKPSNLNMIGIILFAISVSLDSFSLGIGITYLYENVYLSCLLFCIISMVFTLIGFLLGNKLSYKIGKYSYLLGGLILLIYSIIIIK